MKDFRRLSVLALLLVSGILLCSCGKPDERYNKIPRTNFISHYQQSKDDWIPFASYWRNPDVKLSPTMSDDKKIKKEYLYIKPVNMRYLSKGSYNSQHEADIKKLGGYFDKRLHDEFEKRTRKIPRIELAHKPTGNAYTLEVAIVCIKPTPVGNNVTNSIIDMAVAPISRAWDNPDKAGYIGMAAKFKNPQGKTLIELADYQTDQSSMIADFKSFTLFSHHKTHIDFWSRQLSELLSSKEGAKITKQPKYRLNPF